MLNLWYDYEYESKSEKSKSALARSSRAGCSAPGITSNKASVFDLQLAALTCGAHALLVLGAEVISVEDMKDAIIKWRATL